MEEFGVQRPAKVKKRPRRLPRTLNVLMAAVLFLAGFTVFHITFMMGKSFPAESKLQSRMETLDGYEIKIKQIEGDITRNHETIRSIKLLIKQLIKGDKGSLAKLQSILNIEGEGEKSEKATGVEMHIKPAQGPAEPKQPAASLAEEGTNFVFRPPISMPPGMCGLAETPSATVDVKMTDVYRKLPFDNPDGGVWKQGWDITYNASQWNKKKLRVFVAPHSHTDPGWVKTFNDYYQQQTKFIFEHMLTKLEQYPKMKFIYAEMSFFSLWWDEIDPSKKARVKKLLDNGQLEIVTGGWVMTDEASAHYFAMVDQMIEGHQWLEHTVGVKPKAGWSIDPFGLSSTMAYLLKRMGFTNMLIQRVHYSIKKYLSQERYLEFMWRQPWDNAGSTDILCHAMPFYSYDIPHTCGPDPKVCCQFDFIRLPGSRYSCPWKVNPVPITRANVLERSQTLLDQYRKKAQLYRSNVLFVPLGDDFRYDKAEEWDKQYINYQTIFDHVNSDPEFGAELQFGTLSDYFNALYEDTDTKPGKQPPGFPALSGDFFTYADRDDHYWTGYFTSRPFYKRLDRIVEAHLRSAEILYTLALAYADKHTSANFPTVDLFLGLIKARRSLGLFQHHDAIAGTAKDFVVIDYAQKLLEAVNDCKKTISVSATFLLTPDRAQYTYSNREPLFQLEEMMADHESLPSRITLEVDSTPRSFLLVNSLAQRRVQVVSIMATACHVEVKDTEGSVVHSQAIPVWLSQQEMDSSRCEIWFVAEVPALGIARYTMKIVEPHSNRKHHMSAVVLHNAADHAAAASLPFKMEHMAELREFSIETATLKAEFDGRTGMLQAVTSLEFQTKHKAALEFVRYGVKMSKERSGAYIFLPDGEAKVEILNNPWMRVIRGPLMSEVRVFTPSVEHVVRLHNSPGPDNAALEIFNIVDIRNAKNSEIAMRITTDVHNNDTTFYTDLNGFMMHERRTYSKLPLQANFYPMTSMAFLEGGRTRVSLLSAQSLGFANLRPGVMEVMMDRRLDQDDNRGLGQGVMDNKRTPNSFYLLFERRIEDVRPPYTDLRYPSLLATVLSSHLIHSVFVLPATQGRTEPALQSSFDPVSKPLPCELHLVNLRLLQNKDDSPELKFIPPGEAALLVHHQATDCSFPAKYLTCTPNSGKFSIQQLFKDFRLPETKVMTLSLMNELSTIGASQEQGVMPMEIQTYKIRLQ